MREVSEGGERGRSVRAVSEAFNVCCVEKQE